MKKGEQNQSLLSGSNRMILKFALLLLYLTALCYGLFFAESFGRTRTHSSYNIIPFYEIRRYLGHIETMGWQIVLLNLAGNVVVFIPFGFLIPSMWPKNDKRHPIGLIFLTVLFSVSIEILQYLTAVGSADVDDVILNALGGFIGYLLYSLWRKIRYE